MEISQKILNYMESKGVSAYKISKSTGISESTFSKWKSKPTSKLDSVILDKIAEYFKITIDELLGNEQKNKPAAKSDELNEMEKKLLLAFRSLNEGGQDMILRAAGVDPENIKKEDSK